MFGNTVSNIDLGLGRRSVIQMRCVSRRVDVLARCREVVQQVCVEPRRDPVFGVRNLLPRDQRLAHPFRRQQRENVRTGVREPVILDIRAGLSDRHVLASIRRSPFVPLHTDPLSPAAREVHLELRQNRPDVSSPPVNPPACELLGLDGNLFP